MSLTGFQLQMGATETEFLVCFVHVPICDSLEIRAQR